MERTDSIKIIKAAVDQGRPSTTDIVPGTVLHHFLYKSKANVQFAMSSFDPDFSSVSRRRRSVDTFSKLPIKVLPHITNYCFWLDWCPLITTSMRASMQSIRMLKFTTVCLIQRPRSHGSRHYLSSIASQARTPIEMHLRRVRAKSSNGYARKRRDYLSLGVR